MTEHEQQIADALIMTVRATVWTTAVAARTSDSTSPQHAMAYADAVVRGFDKRFVVTDDGQLICTIDSETPHV